MANKKPTLNVGEYGEPRPVKYVDKEDPELSGTYVVELGAEFATKRRETNRWVRVEGHVLEIWAMTTGGGKRVVEWDENILRQRAAKSYVHNVRRPVLEKERGQEAWAAYVAALMSPADWVVEVDKQRGKISIQPIDLKFEADWQEMDEHFLSKRSLS
jgi:hypothetical protein